MRNEVKNPIPFNPQHCLTGGETRDALEALRNIFETYGRGGDADEVAHIVYSEYVQLQRKFKK